MLSFEKVWLRFKDTIKIIRGSICMAIAFYISPPSSPLSFFLPVTPFLHCLPARAPPPRPWDCGRSHSLLCCIAFARGHKKTAENLCRYSRPFHRVCSQSTVSEKMTSRPALRYPGRGPAVTHLSTDPAPRCLTCASAWCRAPTTHRTLSMTYIYIYIYIYTSGSRRASCASTR